MEFFSPPHRYNKTISASIDFCIHLANNLTAIISFIFKALKTENNFLSLIDKKIINISLTKNIKHSKSYINSNITTLILYSILYSSETSLLCTYKTTYLRSFRFHRTFLEVVDGDTIAININTPKDSLSQAILKDRILVRIRGIDTPELSSTNDFVRAKAYEAKQLVETRLKKGKKVYLKNVDRDKYFRLLADLEIDGKSIADELIYLGLAYKYDGGKKLLFENISEGKLNTWE